ncbi:hypothetical protein ZOSMA_11G01200 [Zostera marina]|uniref:Uncharacterized protein n=1 Tax=Zostera marina TaxID=29655 RepID=A0A0K9Q1C0_ZOSMR|nr:hypothetical protein ZOSMA_11G01200 [Zostera marina]
MPSIDKLRNLDLGSITNKSIADYIWIGPGMKLRNKSRVLRKRFDY